MDKKALVELAKSFGRFMWFGLVALFVTFLTNLVVSGALNNTTITIAGNSINIGYLVVAAIGFVIKAIDRYRHVSESTDSNGLAPSFLQD